VSAVHAGESTVEIETEADSNDMTETADPLYDKPSTGMFLDAYLFLCHMVPVCFIYYCCFYTQKW